MKRGRKNARCKAMERNTTTTITTITTRRETRAHIPGNDNDDGTILTEIFVFLDFFGCISTSISYTNLLPIRLLFQIALPLSLQAYYYYDEDCTLSHRNTYLPTLRDSNISPPASVTFSRCLPLSLFLSSLSSPSSNHTYGILGTSYLEYTLVCFALFYELRNRIERYVEHKYIARRFGSEYLVAISFSSLVLSAATVCVWNDAMGCYFMSTR